jgi:hypothetical protein
MGIAGSFVAFWELWDITSLIFPTVDAVLETLEQR